MVNHPVIRCFTPSMLSVGWDWRDVGYGEIIVNTKHDQIEISNNNLTKDEVKLILHRFVEYVVDNGTFIENRND